MMRTMVVNTDALYLALMCCVMVGALIGNVITLWIVEHQCAWCEIPSSNQVQEGNDDGEQ